MFIRSKFARPWVRLTDIKIKYVKRRQFKPVTDGGLDWL